MTRTTIIFITCLLFTSCSVTKDQFKNKKDISDVSEIETRTTRPGDTLTFSIPNIQYRDTVITRVNYETRTVASVKYDNAGNKTFECISAEIDEFKREMREFHDNSKIKDKEKEETFNPQYFIYALAALALVVVIGFIAFARMIPGIAARAAAAAVQGMIK